MPSCVLSTIAAGLSATSCMRAALARAALQEAATASSHTFDAPALLATSATHGMRTHSRRMLDSEPLPPAVLALPPCPPLNSILRSGAPSSVLGNFTQEPDFDQIGECESIYAVDGNDIYLVLRQRDPLVKLVNLNTIVTEYPHDSVPVVRGSVSVIDCNDSWIDLSATTSNKTEVATVVWLNCKVLFGTNLTPAAAYVWFVNSTYTVPCLVRDPAVDSGLCSNMCVFQAQECGCHRTWHTVHVHCWQCVCITACSFPRHIR